MTNEDAKKLIQQRKAEIWRDIEKLSELKSNYNCFDEKEEPYYRALSNAIQALREKERKIGDVKNGDIIL